MPDWSQLQGRRQAPAQPTPRGSIWGGMQVGEPVEEPMADPMDPTGDTDTGTEGGIDPTMAVAGAAAGVGTLGLLAKLAQSPGRLGMVGKAASGLNSLRQQLMLSGFALPKSLLGNVGATVEASMEGKTLNPVRQLLSRQTLRDAKAAYKTGGVGSGTPGVDQATMHGPGRLMGAFDEATQGALRRSGMSADDAQRATLQAPLQGDLAEALDSPVARYVHPFRRTPFNQFIEGWKKLKPENIKKNPGTTAAYLGAGAAHGALTAEDELPVSIPLATAAAARYGLGYTGAAILGRMLAGGSGDGGAASGALPVSEYGFESSITDPTRPFRKPAALTALERMTQ